MAQKASDKWQERACGNCKSQILVKAVRCPVCMQLVRPAWMSANAPDTPNRRVALILLVGGVIMAVNMATGFKSFQHSLSHGRQLLQSQMEESDAGDVIVGENTGAGARAKYGTEPLVRGISAEEAAVADPEALQRDLARYDAEIAADPRAAQAYIDRAWLLQDHGRFEAARKDLSRAIAIDPGNADALARRALVQLSLEQFAAAREDALKALELNQQDQNAQDALDRANASLGLDRQ